MSNNQQKWEAFNNREASRLADMPAVTAEKWQAMCELASPGSDAWIDAASRNLCVELADDEQTFISFEWAGGFRCLQSADDRADWAEEAQLAAYKLFAGLLELTEPGEGATFLSELEAARG